jgi:hypothetical protein
MDNKEVCQICESYIDGVVCEDTCPVEKLFTENKRLIDENNRLKHEMSYMVLPGPYDVRFREMGQ